jgi:glutathione S-transferase
VGAPGAEKAKDGLKYFDEVLEDRRFVTGDAFTMPDITLYAGIYFAKAVNLVPDNFPALMAWHQRVSYIPAVKNRSGQEFLAEDLARISS